VVKPISAAAIQTRKPMKFQLPLATVTLASGLLVPVLHAGVQPYTADANTVYLYHLNEAALATSAANAGSSGFNAIAFDGNPANNNATTAQPVATNILGATGYTGFGNAANISAIDLGLGVDANASGGFQMGLNGGASPDAILHSSFAGADGSFTMEAMLNIPAITGPTREIICTDNSVGTRGFQFRINATGNLEFNFIGTAPAAYLVPIPTTGTHGFVANQWFHVALSYDGPTHTTTYYWTRVSSGSTTANVIGTPGTVETTDGAVSAPLVIGNEARSAGSGVNSGEGLIGLMDEVRISKVARTASQFIFYNGDSDGDFLDDAWEIANFGSITAYIGTDDPDHDTFDNEAEETAGTNPNSAAFTPADTDGDGLPDAWEVTNFGNITAQNGSGDPDADYATNAQEYAAGKSPTSRSEAPDADGDGMGDAWEIHYFGNTARLPDDDADLDGDSNVTEYLANTHPNDVNWSTTKSELAHRWSFNNSLNDSKGTSNATLIDPDNDGAIGGTATLSATDVLLGGGARDTSSYVKLGTNLVKGLKTPVTLEFWATQVGVQNWSRIFDFGASNTEYLTMAWTQAGNVASDMVEFKDAFASNSFNTNQPYTLGTEYHIVMTLEPGVGTGGTTRVTWYSRSVGTPDLASARGTFNTANSLEFLDDTLDALGRSEFAADATANARYNEVRIWNGALTFSERESYHDAGPNNIDLADLDGDLLPDAWEVTNFGNIAAQDGDGDPDHDLYSNLDEYNASSNPNNIFSSPDLDGDGLADGYEVYWFRSAPEELLGDILVKYAGASDPDGDGFSNIDERNAVTGAPAPDPGTNPLSATFSPIDIDGDLLPDSWEILYFTNLAQVGSGDSDTDGSTNAQELAAGSNPTLASSTAIDADNNSVADTAEHFQPYSVDSSTLHLWHLDETRPVASDAVSNTTPLPNLANGGLLWTPSKPGFKTGLDVSANRGTAIGASLSALPLSDGANDNTALQYAGADGAFTFEAIVKIGFDPLLVQAAGEASTPMQIVSGEGDTAINRVWQFRINPRGTGNAGAAPTLEFVNIHAEVGVQTITVPLPIGADPNAIVQGSWYHVAVAYNGAEATADNFKLYWTLLDPSRTTANQLLSSQMTTDLITESPDFVIGNEGRATGGSSGTFVGVIDEVRISSVARSAGGFLFTAAGDADADGLPDAWETTYFGGLGETATGDFEGDGTNNLTEYRLGLIPNNGSSRFAATRAANGLLSWPSATGVTFTVQRSQSLAAGSWTTIGTVPGTAGTASFTDPSPPVGTAFYKVLLQP